MLALKLQEVTKHYGSIVALDKVSLTIEAGEIFALLGPNGAGKSTLIHCVTGLSTQSSGAITVFGYDTLQEFRTTRRLTGLVPQEVAFDSFFTPFETLMNQMGFMGIRPDARRVRELLELFSLADQRDSYLFHLSGGMKRRLLIAKALVHYPKLLFLDEPTAGVDVELRKELWTEVRKLAKAGTTIVLTTHYLEEAEQLADRIGIINHGQLFLVETRDKLISRYQNAYVTIVLNASLSELPNCLPIGTTRINDSTLVIPWNKDEPIQPLLNKVSSVGDIVTIDYTHTTLEDIFLDLVAAASKRV